VTEKYARKKKLVDFDVQGTLVIRAVFYWILCVLVTGLVLLGWQILVAPDGPFWSYFRLDLLWIQYRAALIASLFTLPLILIDAIHVSHRFTGPNSRLRRSMRALAAGEEVELIRFRGNDFWQKMADEFNDVAIYVEKLKRQAGVISTTRSKESHDESSFEPSAVN
jgi:hypothetical protein